MKANGEVEPSSDNSLPASFGFRGKTKSHHIGPCNAFRRGIPGKFRSLSDAKSSQLLASVGIGNKIDNRFNVCRLVTWINQDRSIARNFR